MKKNNSKSSINSIVMKNDGGRFYKKYSRKRTEIFFVDNLSCIYFSGIVKKFILQAR